MELPFAITLDVGSSHANRTGSWRVTRPNYVDRLPPCNNACPAGENIQQWLYRAEPGDYESAWRQLVEDNPFPAVMGRICYHPCETAIGPSWMRRSESTPSNGSWVIWPSSGGGRSPRRTPTAGSACW
jgi:hypothetical protein